MTVVPFTIKQLAQESDAAYVVKCLRAESYLVTLNAHRDQIYTNYLMQVTETLKGEERGTVIVMEAGGQVGAILQWIPGAPIYATGEEAVVFLHKSPDGFTTKGWAQGKFLIETATDTGRRTVRRNLGGLSFLDPKGLEKMKKEADRLAREGRAGDSSSNPAAFTEVEGPKDPPAITLDDFLAEVRKYVGDSGRRRRP